MSELVLIDRKKIGTAIMMIEKDINEALQELRILRVQMSKGSISKSYGLKKVNDIIMILER